MIARIGKDMSAATIIDVGCSSGYLLEDLCLQFPRAALIGVDIIFAGLRAARADVPSCSVVQADAGRLPFALGSADAIVSANLLEHVPADLEALGQMFAVVRPGARVVIVVPAGERLYDYYDRFLHHQRRYGRCELASKARSVGFEILDDFYLGSLVYPAFWAAKKRNRLFRDQLSGEALQRQVASDIAHTQDSRLGRISTRLERALLARSIKLPFGIRELVLLRKPA